MSCGILFIVIWLSQFSLFELNYRRYVIVLLIKILYSAENVNILSFTLLVLIPKCLAAVKAILFL